MQAALEETLEFIQDLNSALPLYDFEGSAIKIAPSLRQQARDLRAKSETLRSRNAEVMQRATDIALRCFVVNQR